MQLASILGTLLEIGVRLVLGKRWNDLAFGTSAKDSEFYFQNFIFEGAKMPAHSSLKASNRHDSL